MNFTREPIIETIVSAKEGYKLSIKNSKHQAEEEYLVDAVEVVSFSGALFYRSQEKPKPFFLPIHDYEIMEVREARLTIKSPVVEKSIKISGGKQPKQEASYVEEKAVDGPVEEDAEPVKDEQVRQPQRHEGKQREKRQKYRRKRGGYEDRPRDPQAVPAVTADGSPAQPAMIASPTESVFSHLLKPPESLISDSIHKYKKMETEALQSPEVAHDLQVQESESPREYERFEEEVIETLMFTPEKPQE